jgi:hypothetical protein
MPTTMEIAGAMPIMTEREEAGVNCQGQFICANCGQPIVRSVTYVGSRPFHPVCADKFQQAMCMWETV